jgi:hypothetical protein
MLPERNLYIFLALLFALSGGYFKAIPASASDQEWNGQREFITKGQMDIQLVSGLLFSTEKLKNNPSPKTAPDTHYWQNNLRLGWILNNAGQKESFFRGNFEAMLEISYSVIYKGPGTYLAGGTALIRYNFVPPGSKWIPYVQAGVGVVHTNAYKDHSQDAIGQAIEFTPQGSVGIRYFFKEKWSVDFEGIFQHISNSNLSERNVGLNSFGGFIGISYLYDRSGTTK